jgi:hypothetical protein
MPTKRPPVTEMPKWSMMIDDADDDDVPAALPKGSYSTATCQDLFSFNEQSFFLACKGNFQTFSSSPLFCERLAANRQPTHRQSCVNSIITIRASSTNHGKVIYQMLAV